MTRVHGIALRLLIASFALCSAFAATALAQTSTPPAPQEPTKTQTPDKKPEAQENPFAPEPAAPLPAGMTGSDTSDPRAKCEQQRDDGNDLAGLVGRIVESQLYGPGARRQRHTDQIVIHARYRRVFPVRRGVPDFLQPGPRRRSWRR